MKLLSRKECQSKLKNHEPLFLVDEINEVAYDFTNYPKLRVKSKGGKIIERMEEYTESETNAWISGVSISEKEFEKY